MHVDFNFEKAVQAAAFMLSLQPDRKTNFMRFLKLLYIADRESIRDTGFPITTDKLVAMRRGMTLSHLYNCIKKEHPRCDVFNQFIERENLEVRLTHDAGFEMLSPFEMNTLRRVSVEHANHDQWALEAITHGFEEWQKHNPGNSSRFVETEDVMDALKMGDDRKREVEEQIKVDQQSDYLFGK